MQNFARPHARILTLDERDGSMSHRWSTLIPRPGPPQWLLIIPVRVQRIWWPPQSSDLYRRLELFNRSTGLTPLIEAPSDPRSASDDGHGAADARGYIRHGCARQGEHRAGRL